jgi:hypothetical protein
LEIIMLEGRALMNGISQYPYKRPQRDAYHMQEHREKTPHVNQKVRLHQINLLMP